MKQQDFYEEEFDDEISIDFVQLFRELYAKRRVFIKVWIVTFVVASIIILPVPPTYTSTVSLAPELSSGSSTASSLSSLAGSLGVSLGGSRNADAFYPTIYPQVVGSKSFAVGLLDIPVETIDSSVKTDLTTYLRDHQQTPYYLYPMQWIGSFMALFKKGDNDVSEEESEIDPKHLSASENALVQAVTGKIKCDVDKKTFVVTITVTDQDPLVCASLADSVRTHLQQFIIDYRTNKARTDAEYYERLTREANGKYQQALADYAAFTDAHSKIVLQQFKAKQNQYENAVQIALTAYNNFNASYQMALAKVQERKPSFTVIDVASVPNQATGPKRKLFVLAMLFLATLVTMGYVLRSHFLGNSPK